MRVETHRLTQTGHFVDYLEEFQQGQRSEALARQIIRGQECLEDVELIRGEEEAFQCSG